MIVTKRWLEDFVDLSGVSVEQIVDRFINIGFEVEEVHDLGKGMERVKVGRIVKLSRHPNAERLQICTISLGGGEMVQILTAATNVFEGALVPCALDGADLPNGVLIKTTNMRGEVSMGMLCSGEELKIDDSVYPNALVDGIMILDESAHEGQQIAEFLGLDDVVFDIKVLANRPDCQSVMGLAKELAVALEREFKPKNYAPKTVAINMPLTVEVATEACPLYFAGVIADCEIMPSNEAVRRRLSAIGIKPKNTAVDLTNYVLWETGQPIHAFDYDKIEGGKIIIRKAKAGEKLLGFDDKEYELTPEMVVVADAHKPIGIAGVMGGKEFSISPTTRNIVIESAIYDRVSIRRTSRALGLRTDASARFERGVAPIFAKIGMESALGKVSEFGFGKVGDKIVCVGELSKKRTVVEVKIAEIYTMLGIEIPVNEMLKILDDLGIETQIKDGKILECVAPETRDDITKPADIIEEIIRFYGFGAIVPTYSEKTASLSGGMDEKARLEYEILNYALSSGANQVRTYGFRSPVELDKLLLPKDSELRDCVQITNPLSLDYSIMRRQMIGSLLSVASFNESHKNENIKICEIGKIFINDRSEEKQIPTENKVLAYLTTGNTDFFTVKSLSELIANKLNITLTYEPMQISFMHPNICASILIGKQQVGLIGKVHPQVTGNFDIREDCYYLELNLDKLPPKKFKKIKPLPKFPASFRDLAIVVDKKVHVGEILQCIKKSAGNILESVELFDIYEGEQVGANNKSVAFNLTFRKTDATLTQDEVNCAVDKILEKLGASFDAHLRG